MDPGVLVEQLRRSVDAHDLDAVVACFADEYRNETPAHPARGFEGSEQVRRNWQRIFAGIPNIAARVLRMAVDGDVVWSEWEMGGSRADDTPQMLRGVVIFGVAGNQFGWARFYLEPVDAADDSVDAAVGKIVESDRR